MDPYAAAQTQTTYQPTPSSATTTTSSSQIQLDPYIYSQKQSYDPSQYAAYYQQYDQSQYYDPQSYYQTAPPEQQQPQPQPEQTQQQEHVPIHPPGVPVQPDPNQYTDPYYQTNPNAAAYYQTDPNVAYYYSQPQTQTHTPQVAQQQPVSYSYPGVVVPPGQQPWQHYQAQAIVQPPPPLYPPSLPPYPSPPPHLSPK